MENSIYQKELNTKNVLLFMIPTMIMMVIHSLFGGLHYHLTSVFRH